MPPHWSKPLGDADGSLMPEPKYERGPDRPTVIAIVAIIAVILFFALILPAVCNIPGNLLCYCPKLPVTN